MFMEQTRALVYPCCFASRHPWRRPAVLLIGVQVGHHKASNVGAQDRSTRCGHFSVVRCPAASIFVEASLSA